MYFQRYTCANICEQYVHAHYFQGYTNQNKNIIFTYKIRLKKQHKVIVNCQKNTVKWHSHTLLVGG